MKLKLVEVKMSNGKHTLAMMNKETGELYDLIPFDEKNHEGGIYE